MWIIGCIIFLFTFILIISNRIHRTIAAMCGAGLMILFGVSFGFYSYEDAISSIDFNTIGLLIGMMLIVSRLKKTGIFNYLAIRSAKMGCHNPFLLLIVFGIMTAIVSMFIDNVTTIMLIAPITLLICEILGISPIPLLMTECLLSNIGGVGTLIGDPPNIMISSASGLGFNAFLLHLMPVVMVTIGASILVLRLIFRKELKTIQPDKRVLIDEDAVIKEGKGLKRSLGVLGGVILCFFLHQPLRIPTSMVALLGGTLLLILTKANPEEALNDIEWPLIFFFISFFMLVGGIEKMGVFTFISQKVSSLAKSNMILAAILLLWVGAIVSSFVGNIPFTATMIPLIKQIGSTGIDVEPLWWALALGVGFGGNGTPIGSSAGILIINVSERAKRPISFKEWIKVGGLVTFISCGIGAIFFLLFPQLYR